MRKAKAKRARRRFHRHALHALPLGSLYGVLTHVAYSLHAATNPDVAALHQWWNQFGYKLNQERAQEDEDDACRREQ